MVACSECPAAATASWVAKILLDVLMLESRNKPKKRLVCRPLPFRSNKADSIPAN